MTEEIKGPAKANWQDDEAREQAAKEKEDIVDLFGSLAGRGYQLQITRRSPSWCQGYLDTWPIDERVSLNDIRDSWGGSRFSLAILKPNGTYLTSRNVLIDAEPRRYGQVITQHQIHNEKVLEAFHPPVPAAPDTTLSDIIKLMMTANQNQVNTLSTLLQSRQEAVDPLSSFSQTAQMLGMLKELANDFSPQESGEGGMGIAKLFLEELTSRKKEVAAITPPQRQQRRRPPQLPAATRQAPPRQAPAPPQAAQAAPAAPAAPAPQAPITNPAPAPAPAPEYEKTIAEELSEAGPIETAEILREVFESWTPDLQKLAIQTLLAGDLPTDPPIEANDGEEDQEEEDEHDQEEEDDDEHDDEETTAEA